MTSVVSAHIGYQIVDHEGKGTKLKNLTIRDDAGQAFKVTVSVEKRGPVSARTGVRKLAQIFVNTHAYMEGRYLGEVIAHKDAPAGAERDSIVDLAIINLVSTARPQAAWVQQGVDRLKVAKDEAAALEDPLVAIGQAFAGRCDDVQTQIAGIQGKK
jgi:hypothetical protein